MFINKGYKPKYKTAKFQFKKDSGEGISLWRLLAQYFFVLFIFLTIITALFKLQIVKGDENLFLSGSNQEREVVLKAPRGLIYDANNTPLVYNSPSFRVMFDNSAIYNSAESKEEKENMENEVFASLGKILNYDQKKLISSYLDQSRSSGGDIIKNDKITILKGLSRDEVLGIYPNLDKLVGVYIQIDEKRVYTYPVEFSQILGYTGDVTQDDLDKNKDLTYIDDIGKSGVEEVYDDTLRGKNGVKIAQQDIENNTKGEYTSVYAEKGKDLKLYLDVNVQKKLYELLTEDIKDRDTLSAAAAIQDIETGGLIGAVSVPSYDPNKLRDNIEDYVNDDRKLFLNRLISAYPPGSTFKTFTSNVLLQEGVINENSSFADHGSLPLGGDVIFRNYQGRALGTLKVRDALALSSNLFFCNFSLNADSKIFEKYAPNFHIGKVTGVDLTNEAAGQLSSPIVKKELVNEAWYPGDNCNLAIGQGYTVVTPMQMLSWVSAIANDGDYVQPRVVSSVLDEDKGIEEEFGRKVENDLGISKENLKIVREGMHQGVQVGANGIGGTGGYLKGPGDMSSKTGTAEATVKKDGVWVKDTHAWVVGFFPYDKPKYSFVLFLEGGGVGGNDAAPIMRKFLDWFIEYEKLSFEQ